VSRVWLCRGRVPPPGPATAAQYQASRACRPPRRTTREGRREASRDLWSALGVTGRESRPRWPPTSRGVTDVISAGHAGLSPVSWPGARHEVHGCP
jgi:hypothetical protein